MKINYSDETTSGCHNINLRGLSQVIISASCFTNTNFDWLLKLKKDFEISSEIKSKYFLDIILNDSKLFDFVLNNIFNSTIIIIDIYYHLRDILTEIDKTINNHNNSDTNLEKFLKGDSLPKNYIKNLLEFVKINTISFSPISGIEELLIKASKDSDIFHKKELFDRNLLKEMNDKEFKELITRFTVAFADALDPKKQAKIITDKIKENDYFCNESEIAYEVLSNVVDRDLIYDDGYINAFKKLEDSHKYIIDILNKNIFSKGRIVKSKLKQSDSKKVLGLQVADLTAGIARYFFEKNYNNDTLVSANVVRKYFNRVFLNSKWL